MEERTQESFAVAVYMGVIAGVAVCVVQYGQESILEYGACLVWTFTGNICVFGIFGAGGMRQFQNIPVYAGSGIAGKYGMEGM